MAGDDFSPIHPVAAAFARLAADAHAVTPPEARYQPTGTRLDRWLEVLNGLIVLGMLLAVTTATSPRDTA